MAANTHALASDASEAAKSPRMQADGDADALRRRVFELGLWARGLENYCATGRLAFPISSNQTAERNYKGEFHVTLSVLIKCSDLIAEILRNASESNAGQEAREFEEIVAQLITLNRSMTQNERLSHIDWDAWRVIVAQRVSGTLLYDSFETDFDFSGQSYLPEKLQQLLEGGQLGILDRADLKNAVPRLGGILMSLEVVAEMLKRDAPLRPALAIFAFVHEAISELVSDINDRLSRSRDETSEVFGMLDAASYTLAMESKKAFSQELAAISGTRSATAVFARVESAHGVLNDTIRQLLSGFLRLSEPETVAEDIFPDFNQKLHESLELRKDIGAILELVRTAESNPAEDHVLKLKLGLEDFLKTTLSYLFYKDRETFERFCDEIMVTTAGPDAGPVLHRFSAYVETLFNQVGMRAVLNNHPINSE